MYRHKENNHDKEIQRRIMADWAAFLKHRDIFKKNLAICLWPQYILLQTVMKSVAFTEGEHALTCLDKPLLGA